MLRLDLKDEVDSLSAGFPNNRFAFVARCCFACTKSCDEVFPSNLGLDVGDIVSGSAIKTAVRSFGLVIGDLAQSY